MHIESPRSARSLKAVTFLRVPVLLAVGMMTMGSGMGNPGCGSGSSIPDCKEGCAIEGTYTLQFADTSPPGGGCERLGVGLPQGPLVLEAAAGYVTGRLDGVTLTTYYSGEPSRKLDFAVGQFLTDQKLDRNIRITSTVAAPSPRSPTDRSVIEGKYVLELASSENIDLKCFIERDFTATR
ncbi:MULTISPECIES: hypothetical protein [Corallococcus]|uniref:Uncharacterized protein n=2 Tax=Corallococcus TaxID=83461 RepID=A0A7Y4JRK7_9BACT|nr:hypothetical protein [Corallococcus exercitus]NOK08957.1 hypothetical protein [Corallococcus exercitus]GMU08609.1 hypothetical protein ASNO1_48620 [Corallococcus sp. NO1]